MRPSEAQKIGEAIARRTTKAQSLPLKIDDPRMVGMLAEMFGPPGQGIGPARKGVAP